MPRTGLGLGQLPQKTSDRQASTVIIHSKDKAASTVQFLIWNPWQSYWVSPAIWDHTVLAATRHKWTRPALTPARLIGTRFTYTAERWKAELTLVLPALASTTAKEKISKAADHFLVLCVHIGHVAATFIMNVIDIRLVAFCPYTHTRSC